MKWVEASSTQTSMQESAVAAMEGTERECALSAHGTPASPQGAAFIRGRGVSLVDLLQGER